MSDDKPDEVPAVDAPESAQPEAPQAAEQERDRAAEANRAPPKAPPSSPWDGQAAKVPHPDKDRPADTGESKATDDREESLENEDRQTSNLRFDFAAGGTFRDVGEIHHHYASERRERRSLGRIPVDDLERMKIVHVSSSSDEVLAGLARDRRVVFYKGAPSTGRSHSVTATLDRLTQYSRDTSKVTVLDNASEIEDLVGQLEPGYGHLVDCTEAPGAETISNAQLNRAHQRLDQTGFLVILAGVDAAVLAELTVDHVPPELGAVAEFHLAARLLEAPPPMAGTLEQARTQAKALITEARAADQDTRQWLEDLTGAATATPREAVLFAEAIWDWTRRRQNDPGARPRVNEFRGRHRYELAAGLLRRRDGADSLLRQSYALSAAVLDGLALNEVIDGAGQLSTRLAEVEHPGEPGQREIFAQPLARWLRHVEMATSKSNSTDRGGVVVRMPSRELARIVIELAWREYDAARVPVLDWLMALCVEHRDDRVRIRAAQALAFIAAHDYALIKERVLNKWSSRDSRPIEQLAASWLLEAIVLDETSVDKVKELLRWWSRSPERNKRGVAVRSYGTAIATKVPEDAIQGIRISAVIPDLGALPELALLEIYRLRLTKEVITELTLWMQGFPTMREKAGRVLVRISQLGRIAAGKSDGPFDLLWLLAHEPDKVGVPTAQVAELWLVACSYPNSRNFAWRMLGEWAKNCRRYPDLSDAFDQLIDDFDKAADDDLRERLRLYRRWWKSSADEETQK
jgi:hypothetical protein